MPVIQISDNDFIGTVSIFFVYINGITQKISSEIKHRNPPKKNSKIDNEKQKIENCI